MLQPLHDLLCLCWREGAGPQDVCDASIATLCQNKGDRSDCNNYRGISLLSIGVKVFARILLTRLQTLAARVYPQSQCGLSSGIFGTLCVESLGCRLTTVIGGVLTAIGYTIGSQMNNIYVLYFTLGILPGIGVSLAYTAGMVHLNRQFSKWRPIAVGISVTGTAIGMLTWPLLSAAVAENMGWTGTFLINGALTMNFLPCALWITPRNSKGDVHCPRVSLKETIINCFKIHRLPGALAFCIALLPYGFGYFTFPTFLPDYVTASPFNMTSSEAALIVSSSGYGSMFGRVFFCGIAMVNKHSTKYILLFSGCLCGISNLIVPLCDGPATLHISSAVNGLAIGELVSSRL
ncbi:monocarboxylate transporter 4-like [Haliotis rubra]|uniref:monocarboxylate transporter 4-like n=1 Tax=Haliotis rubra TaxID=36100 RepID=UPI001EE5280E|nr:monocarboxylate transporter 4-like [Haliotis rubra]